MEAEVLFVYNPQRPDELPLAVGQIITDVELVDDGWASGKLNGKTGMFPDNFVKIYKKPEAPPPLPDERPPVPLPAEPPKPEAVLSPPPKPVKKLRAAFAYEALNEDELTLAVDDILDFIAVEEEGWWRGRLNGKEGVFPSNFVEEKTTSSSQELPPRPEKPAMTHSDRPAPPIPTQPVERTSQQAEPAPPIPNRLEEAPPLFPEKALVDKVDGANGEPIKKGLVGGKAVLPAVNPQDLKKRAPPPPIDKSEKTQPPPPLASKPRSKPPPTAPKSRAPVPLPKSDSALEALGDNEFEGLPDHQPLDHPNRPKGPARKPPSQKLSDAQPPTQGTSNTSAGGAPWQRELKVRKSTTPAAAKPPHPVTRNSDPLHKEGSVTAIPTQRPQVDGPASGVNADWKTAFDELKADLKRLRDEYRKDIDILTDDLDKERKKVRELEVDIDRLKKSPGYREHLA